MNLHKVSDDGQVVGVACTERVTAADLAGGRDPMESLLGPSAFRRRVLLDLGGASAIDSSGIAWLVRTDRRFRQEGGKVVLHSVPPSVMDIMRVMRLPTLLHVASDEAQARAEVLQAP